MNQQPYPYIREVSMTQILITLISRCNLAIITELALVYLILNKMFHLILHYPVWERKFENLIVFVMIKVKKSSIEAGLCMKAWGSIKTIPNLSRSTEVLNLDWIQVLSSQVKNYHKRRGSFVPMVDMSMEYQYMLNEQLENDMGHVF